MNQSHWTYWDDYGRQHVVGILHGPKTGHLVVHCNSKVMIIDFNVNQPKTYSFCIDENMCKLKVKGTDGNFNYELGVNENLNSAKHQLKRTEDRKFMYQKIGSLVAAVSILVFVALILQSCQTGLF